MPQRGRKPSSNKKPQATEITCLACGITKKSKEFYASSSVFNAGTGRVQYCRECCLRMSCNEDGTINIEKFQSMLQKMDKPFLRDVLQSAYDESKRSDKDTHPLGLYFKNINSLMQYRSLVWKDSYFEDEPVGVTGDKNKSQEHIIVDNDLVNLWGDNWKPDEYIRLHKFYKSMVDINKPETPQDEDYIRKIARLSIQIDKAIQSGDSKTAKSLGDLYSKYMADAKLRTTDTSDADKAGGIRRFCDIFSEVEKDGFIPPWEYYRKINGAKQDIVDKTIMFILNFMLKFNKSDKLTQAPENTPKLEEDEIDKNADYTLELEDLDVVKDG